MYEDCNNNADFLRSIFVEAQSFSETELRWTVSDIEIVPLDQGDYGISEPDSNKEMVYNFSMKVLSEKKVLIRNSELMEILNLTKTIFNGKFVSNINDNSVSIKIFDGDIIEVQGNIELTMIENREN